MSYYLKMKQPNDGSKSVVGITFDLDDTLWCGKTVLTKADIACQDFLRQAFPKITTTREDLHVIMADLQTKHPAQAHDYTFLRKKALEIVALEHGYDPKEVADRGFEAFITARSQPVFFDGVMESFAKLCEQGIAVGIITNGNCDKNYLPDEFMQHTSFYIKSEDVGKPKPHPDVFQCAKEEFKTIFSESGSFNSLDTLSSQLVHIGDDYCCDIKGAKEVGFRTIWVKPNYDEENIKLSSSEYSHADAVVNDITEIFDVILGWDDVSV